MTATGDEAMNSPEAHREEERIFDEAVLQPPAARAAFLMNACGNDLTLLQRVSELLREHDQSTNALDRAPGLELRGESPAGIPSQRGSEEMASSSGRYVLGAKLGEGGWGVVHAAEQLHPVRRSVAIKIIKLGMDTRAVVVRFQAERQALALMDHENIARVLDAGETTEGRPFFVMERVPGTRITHFCDAHRLTIPERLELFMRVCDAVQHAHQKGVIHRDLKPSNILVAQVAGIARPKIIDFGIAKATQGRLTDETVVTEIDSFVGTPAYMSPEQADRRDDVVDTRSDIYSLGVVLYELLTGRTPLAGTEMNTSGVEEVRRQIREVEALRPSARIGRLEAAVRQETAERRGTTAARLVDLVAGDLDRVVLKCLEKQPARRYESASALAEDLRRHLDHEPVSAIPAGQWYVWGKFVRRNRMAFGIAGAIGLMLVAAVAVSTLLLFREKAALARAVAAEHAQTRAREEAEKSSQQARTEATRSARATEFMTSVLNGVKPAVARGRDTELLRELLDEAAARLDSGLRDEPEVEADLCDVIGEAFWHIDEPGKAARLHRRALELHERTLGPMHPKVGFSLRRLGIFEMYYGTELEAEKFFRRSYDIRLRSFGAEDPRTLDAMTALVETLARQKRFSEATELFERVHTAQKRIFSPDDLRLLGTEYRLADFLRNDGMLSAAERTLRGIIAKYPADTTGQSLSMFRHQAFEGLGTLLLEQGRIDEAIELLRQNVETSDGQGAPNFSGKHWLAYALHLRGRCEEALPILRSATESARQRVSRDKSRRFVVSLAWAAMLQGGCLEHTGRPNEAEPLLREACSLTFRPSKILNRHPAIDLAKLLRVQGKLHDAGVALESALRQVNREGNEFVFQLLPEVYRDMSAAQDANRRAALLQEQLASEASWIERNGPVEGAPYSLAVLCAIADVGAFDVIAPVVSERLAWWKQHRFDEAPAHAYAVLAGEILLADRRVDEAEQTLLVASAGLERTKYHWKFETLWRAGHLDGALARLYATCERSEEPGRWRRLTNGPTDPAWELGLAHTLFEARRYQEAAEILPGARTRLEEQLARKPGNDRLAASVVKAAALAEECLAKAESDAQTRTIAREEK